MAPGVMNFFGLVSDIPRFCRSAPVRFLISCLALSLPLPPSDSLSVYVENSLRTYFFACAQASLCSSPHSNGASRSSSFLIGPRMVESRPHLQWFPQCRHSCTNLFSCGWCLCADELFNFGHFIQGPGPGPNFRCFRNDLLVRGASHLCQLQILS